MEVYVKDKRIILNSLKSIGKGGEADIFDIGGGKALKLFKPPDHPDFSAFPLQQEAARRRIIEHQEKLKIFPINFPSHVVVPQELATDKSGQKIVGYTMRYIKNAEVLMRYTDKAFRRAGISDDLIVKIFQDLYGAVSGIHAVKAVIGDFNDLNVMVLGEKIYIIDADSFQFGKFLCTVFTEKFLDPLLCDFNYGLVLSKPYNTDSDWYAYSAMLMECFLFVGPYGGVYKPKNPKKLLTPRERAMNRISVFHPDVRYPKPAVPYGILPDDLLHYFHLVFEKDKRGAFPRDLIKNMRWTKCSNCGAEHARNICPVCAKASPSIKELTVIKGEVIATRIFKTSGLILFAALQNEKLLWFYHENGKFKREDNSVVCDGDLDINMRFRLKEKSTFIGRNGKILDLTPNKALSETNVDSYGALPIFDANEYSYYWAQNGQLFREGQFGPEHIGDVLAGQTLFWVGPEFGFGFYRAGKLSVAFVFDAKRRGINDNVKLPPIRGQLVDSTCVFSKDYCWFFIATKESGKTIHRCVVIRKDGSIEALAEAEKGDGSWLSNLRGKCAVGDFLFSATDEGIVRFEAGNGEIAKTREFPDTEPFVDSDSNLFVCKDGIYVVGGKEIMILKIK